MRAGAAEECAREWRSAWDVAPARSQPTLLLDARPPELEVLDGLELRVRVLEGAEHLVEGGDLRRGLGRQRGRQRAHEGLVDVRLENLALLGGVIDDAAEVGVGRQHGDVVCHEAARGGSGRVAGDRGWGKNRG